MLRMSVHSVANIISTVETLIATVEKSFSGRGAAGGIYFWLTNISKNRIVRAIFGNKNVAKINSPLFKFQFCEEGVMNPEEYALHSKQFAPLWKELRTRCASFCPSLDRFMLLCRELVRALMVKDLDSPGGMPAELDEVWHEAILNTELYAKLCHHLRGTFVHHTTASERDSDERKRSCVDQTVLSYRERFLQEPPPSIWDGDDETLFFPQQQQPQQLPVDDNVNIRIFVKSINGATFTFDVMRDSTALAIKQAIQRRDGTPVDHQRLIFAGRVMWNDSTCAQHGVSNGGVIYLVRKCLGC